MRYTIVEILMRVTTLSNKWWVVGYHNMDGIKFFNKIFWMESCRMNAGHFQVGLCICEVLCSLLHIKIQLQKWYELIWVNHNLWSCERCDICLIMTHCSTCFYLIYHKYFGSLNRDAIPSRLFLCLFHLTVVKACFNLWRAANIVAFVMLSYSISNKPTWHLPVKSKNPPIDRGIGTDCR